MFVGYHIGLVLAHIRVVKEWHNRILLLEVIVGQALNRCRIQRIFRLVIYGGNQSSDAGVLRGCSMSITDKSLALVKSNCFSGLVGRAGFRAPEIFRFGDKGLFNKLGELFFTVRP